LQWLGAAGLPTEQERMARYEQLQSEAAERDAPAAVDPMDAAAWSAPVPVEQWTTWRLPVLAP
jgi:hypothetical protein